MSVWQVLFGFRGRISRLTWWLAALGLNMLGAILTPMLIKVLVSEGATVGGSETAPGQLVALGVTGALLWPTLAIAVKRRHDRGYLGWVTALKFVFLIGLNSFPLYYFALSVWAFDHWAWIGLFGLWLGLAFLWIRLIVVLGLLPGSEGSNAFGPPPESLRWRA